LTLSGTPVNGTNFFYAHPTTLLLSPLTSGPQKPFFSTNSSLANTLSIPSTSINTRYLLAGQVVIDASTIERFSYQGSSIKDETLTSNGTVIFSSLRSGVTSTPLSGLVINSQPDFAHWFNALFSNSSLLISTATWGVGSAYLKYTATNIADWYRVLDFSTATTGSVP
jgi:hypothetical protein